MSANRQSIALFGFAWIVYIAGVTVAEGIWALMWKCGLRDSANVVMLVIFAAFTCFAIFKGSVGLSRWCNENPKSNWRFLFSSFLAMGSIPVGILAGMIISLVVTYVLGVDAKTGHVN